jgi:hypothetical protein
MRRLGYGNPLTDSQGADSAAAMPMELLAAEPKLVLLCKPAPGRGWTAGGPAQLATVCGVA